MCCESKSNCGCGGHGQKHHKDSCGCGCHQGVKFSPNFWTKAEKVEWLEDKLEALKEEVKVLRRPY